MAVSKSAKRRAAKKNREGDGEVEESPPVIQQVETEDKAKAKAKAKAMPKCVSCGNVLADDANFCGKCGAKHAQAVAAPKAEPKVAAAPKAEPKVAAAPKAEPKQAVAKSKAAPKNSSAKPTAKSEPKPAPKDEEDEDERIGGNWEEVSGLSKKQQKQKEAKERQKAEEAKMIGGSGQAVVEKLPPGAIFLAEPAKAGAKAKAKAVACNVDRTSTTI
jgi:ribosomal protein S27AE